MGSQAPKNRPQGASGTRGWGGLVLPDWKKYYLAGQMVFACRWLQPDDGDSATVLEEAHLGSYESLRLALYRGTKSNLPLAFTMKATIRAWETAGEAGMS